MILLHGGAIIWFLEKLNNSEQTRIAHPATILALVGQKLHVSTLACINLERKINVRTKFNNELLNNGTKKLVHKLMIEHLGWGIPQAGSYKK